MIRMTLPMSRRNMVEIHGVHVKLTPTVHRHLELWLLLCGQETKTNEFIERMWPDPDDEPDAPETSVTVQMSKLRMLGIQFDCRFSYGHTLSHDMRPGWTQDDVRAAVAAKGYAREVNPDGSFLGEVRKPIVVERLRWVEPVASPQPDVPIATEALIEVAGQVLQPKGDHVWVGSKKPLPVVHITKEAKPEPAPRLILPATKRRYARRELNPPNYFMGYSPEELRRLRETA